jgi:hypothetical protein
MLCGAVIHPPRAGDAVSHGVVLAAATVGVARSEVIGYSVQHRPITAYELGDPHATYRAVVLGSMHGFYERAGEVVTRALRTESIPVGLDLWVIDTLNPDGDALSQRTNAHGVDLNRNWPDLWIPISRAGCTAFHCYYSGPRALSEPETAAMYAFLKRIKPNRVVSMHQPLDGVDTTDGGAKDAAFRDALAHNLNLPLKAFTCYGVCQGSMTAWLTRYTSTTAISVEFAQTVSSAYLSGPAARGILSALMVNVGVPPPPSVSTVAGIARATGATAGGNTVTITGSGFTGAWRVAFGTVLGTSITVLSTTRMTVVAPKHPPGAVDLVITGPGGASTVTRNDRYSYLAPPTVTSVTGIAKASGSTNGGNTVTIIGTGFTDITAVLFGSAPGASIRVLSPSTLTVVVPKHAAGVLDVLVRGTHGTSVAGTPDQYTFVAPPTITSVAGTANATGSTSGGNTVTITGTGFTGITSVLFASVPGTSIKMVSARTVTVTAPPHAVGPVHITLTGTYGTSTPGAADVYSYLDLTAPAPLASNRQPRFGSLLLVGVLLAVLMAGFFGGIRWRWRR